MYVNYILKLESSQKVKYHVITRWKGKKKLG